MSLTTAFRRSMPSLLQARLVSPPLCPAPPELHSSAPHADPHYSPRSRVRAFPAESHNKDKTHASPNDKGSHSEEAVHADRQHNEKVEQAVKNKDKHDGEKTKEQAQKQK